MIKVAQTMLTGHPDKVCDQVADAIIDEFLRRDELSKGSVHVFGGHGAMMISGSIESRADFDCSQIAKRVYRDAGYDDEIEPFVHLGVPLREDIGVMPANASRAQAVCYGFATNQTREMLPPAVVYAQSLARKIDEARMHDSEMKWLLPDGRVLVAMDGKEVKQVVVFAQHTKNATVQDIHGGILNRILRPIIGKEDGIKLYVNPTGSFTGGGLASHTGQSGRRVSADLYGGLIPHGGALLSGRDPGHPARSGTYIARHIAKSLVSDGKASQVFVTLAYMVGRVDPIVFDVRGDKGEDLSEIAKEKFDVRIESVIKQFNLRRPMYRNMAVYGHFGRSDAPWETVGK